MPSVDHSTTGRDYWRSLDELAETEEFQHFLAHEFPNFEGSQEVLHSASRRNFLKIMGASFALVGLTGCRRWPVQKLAPYASRPDGLVPGVPEHYATAWEMAGIANPLLVTTVDGRPIKIEGHPEHPASLGKASHWAQASVLELYDPDRSRNVQRRGADSRSLATWEEFDRAAAARFSEVRAASGRGFAILSEASSSPSVARLRARLREMYPQSTWYEYEPISDDAMIEGAQIAFGRRLRPVLHLDQASVIVSLDHDLLGAAPDMLRNSRGWVRGRASADEGWMNRLYIAEAGFSVTGTVADERIPVPPSRIAALAIAIHAGIAADAPGDVELTAPERAFVDDVVRDLKTAGRHALLVAGVMHTAEVHALCHAVNSLLGSVGTTLTLVDSAPSLSHHAGLQQLCDRLRAGEISTLLIVGGNPAYDAPADLSFAEAMRSATMSMHLSLHDNETSQIVNWHLPRAHYLEAWGDCRAADGTISIVQPMIRPLYEGRSTIELLARILNERPFDGYEIIRTTVRPMLAGELEFEKAWRVVVRNGGIPNSGWPTVTPPRLQRNLPTPTVAVRAASAEYEVAFVADHSMYDGRFANNGWLHELPDPLTKITWDNAVLVSPALARDRGIENEELVDVSVNGQTLRMVAFVLPGVAPATLVLPLGYGRTAAGNVGNEVGFNTYRLRTTANLGYSVSGRLSPTGARYMLATTQNHHLVEDGLLERMYDDRKSDLLREADLATFLAKPGFAKKTKGLDLRLQLWDDPVNYDDGHRWGMAIDLNRCTGCNACVVACQSENNIPIVGKEQVHRGREMHWIRIDRYFKGDWAEPVVSHQPMTCHHCENAPCESVCPVAATVHDHEGLNVMVYNRCIGTRYCSNNCPYKVRRFNYYDWHARDPRIAVNDTMPHLGFPDTRVRDEVESVRKLKFNPEVTVRMRGVMEKCTFCTQRIQASKIYAKNELAKGNRETARVRDGEVTPACAQTCPTEAIVFGDLNDPQSKVRQWFDKARAYTLLDHLNVRPRLTYQARVRNPVGGGNIADEGVFSRPGADHRSGGGAHASAPAAVTVTVTESAIALDSHGRATTHRS